MRHPTDEPGTTIATLANGVRVVMIGLPGVGNLVVSAVTRPRASVRHAAGTASAGRASRASQSRFEEASCPIPSKALARQ